MHIEDAIRAAQVTGFARDIDAHAATVIFLETVQSLVTPARLSQYGLAPIKAVDTIIDIYLSGIVLQEVTGKGE